MCAAARQQVGPFKLADAASSPAARAAYVVIGTIGLAALAVAIVGPKRVRREVLEPLRDAVEPHAERAWEETRPLRDQIAALLEHASPEGRKQLACQFQSWIGHFRAG
jgi:NAD/NADP transhydrogenase alpha subunit